MTSTVTQAIIDAVHGAGSFGAITGGGPVVIGVLIVLVIEQQLAKAFGLWSSALRRVLAVAVWPLALGLVVILAARLVHLANGH
jgi:hypothetical protein